MAKSDGKCKYGPVIDLREIEEETLAEGREWTRKRMEEKLRQRLEDFSPGGGGNAPKRPAAEAEA